MHAAWFAGFFERDTARLDRGEPCCTRGVARAACARYKSVRVTQPATAGQLRFLGPRPVAAAGLPGGAFVALCLVPAERGLYAVYGVSKAGAAPLRLWTQNVANRFIWPI